MLATIEHIDKEWLQIKAVMIKSAERYMKKSNVNSKTGLEYKKRI